MMIVPEIVGREDEKSILDDIVASNTAELAAMYGRRRVGKTYLVRNHLKPHITFEYSGIHNIETEMQLENFTKTMSTQLANGKQLAVPANWFLAFDLMATLLQKKIRKKKLVIFLDEFPWMQTPKSNFLAAFENFWNTWASQKNNIAIILCGSAASWMLQNVVQNKGGLHNRITRKIPLLPFSLSETEAFLISNGIYLNRYQIVQLYMAMGGVPQYLKQAKPGMSAAQIIDKECFTKNGFLNNEFEDLFRALFDTADRHLKVTRALAAKPMGLTRNQLIKNCKLQSGGSTTKLLDELSASGFITPYIPLGKKTKDSIYKLTDEYSRFYLKFIEPNRTNGKGTWAKLSNTQSWKSWSGLAFESICLKHTPAIKMALGIHGIYSENSIWKSIAKPTFIKETSAQIDLLIARQDGSMNICEMKFYHEPLIIDKKYAAELEQKINTFKRQTNTRKQIFLTIVSMYGIAPNEHSVGLVHHSITTDDLFLQKRQEPL